MTKNVFYQRYRNNKIRPVPHTHYRNTGIENKPKV